MHTSCGSKTIPLHVAARVRTLMRQMVTLLKNAATYEANNTVFEKSVDMLYTGLKGFLDEHETLPLRIRKKEIAYGDQVVYVPIGRTDALIHPLYRDGVRKLTFSKDLTLEELTAFAITMVKAKDMDPYESDLVTALWERDLANITYEAEDVYLESDEGIGIDGLAREVRSAEEVPAGPAGTKPADFLLRELGVKSGPLPALETEIQSLCEEDIVGFRSEVAAEDDSSMLEKSSTICLEILETTTNEGVFRRTARFLGEICDWLVSVQEFMPVCSIISDLRAIEQESRGRGQASDAINEVIRGRGEPEKIREIESYIEDLSDAKMEELFCYLGQMDPVATEPMCHLLAEAQTRRVRYMLARAISIVAKKSVEKLEPFLRDERWYVVRNITMILGMIGGDDTISCLKEAAKHCEPRVRREAARALGRVRKPEVLPALRGLIYDENKMIRLAAISAVGLVGDDAASAFMKDAILDDRFEERPTDEKRRLMEVFGTLGAGSVDFLAALIDGRKANLSENGRACAVYGLATSGGNGAARKTLKRLLKEAEGPVKYAASEAISMLDGGMNGSGVD
jgi:hypothetical protein